MERVFESYPVTDKQWEAAKKIQDRLIEKQNFGQHVYFVLNEDGKEVFREYTGACLSALHPSLINGFPENKCHLFTMIMTPDVVKRDQSPLTASTDFTLNHVDWVVNSNHIGQFIPPHTKEQRLECGVPICLNGVPANAPLVSHTILRYPWDRHNKDIVYGYIKLRETFPRICMRELYALSNLIYVDKYKNDFYLSVHSGGHSSFGREASLSKVSLFMKDETNKTFWDKKCYGTTGEKNGIGINKSFKGDGKNISNYISFLNDKIQPNRDKWEDPTLPLDKLKPLTYKILQYLRKGVFK